MKNLYLKNLEKIEFVVTYACTGRCKHCSEGDHTAYGERIDPQLAADTVRKIAAEYDIKTVMTFGGEPLLYPDTTYAVMSVAKELNIQKRQVITNGYFSNNPGKITEVAGRLYECGVNDLLVSVDAFHQETIPLVVVRSFVAEAVRLGIPTRIQPAWLVSPNDGNPYNEKTRELLTSLADLGTQVSEGNVVFPKGNALKYLGEYFTAERPKNPYKEDPCNVKCISFDPNGDVFGGNIYKKDVMEIIGDYNPEKGTEI